MRGTWVWWTSNVDREGAYVSSSAACAMVSDRNDMTPLNTHLQRLDEVVLAVQQNRALVRADVDVARIYAWLANSDICTSTNATY